MITTVLFDLDNTLYPASSGLGLEMSWRMTDFVARYLGIPLEEAGARRRESVLRHGTTLTWLREEHDLRDVDRYLEEVHPTDLERWITAEHVADAQDLLSQIDVRVAVLTNGPRDHAMRVLNRLGLADRFEAVFDLHWNDFVGKPHRCAYVRALEALQVEPEGTLFVDDVVQYLLPFRDLGGTIVHMAAGAPQQPDIPSVRELRDLVPIIYPDRSRG